MTRNEDSARRFWGKVDIVLRDRKLQIVDLGQACGISYKTVTGWRSKHRLPDLESLILIVNTLQCSLDYLLGIKSGSQIYSPRISVIADCLAKDEAKLSAVETLLGIEKSGSSGAMVG